MNKKGSFLFFLAVFFLIMIIMAFMMLFVPNENAKEKADVGQSSIKIINANADYRLQVLNEKVRNEQILKKILDKPNITLEEFKENVRSDVKDYDAKIENKDKLKIILEAKTETNFSKKEVDYEKRVILAYEFEPLKNVKSLNADGK
jgi:hypothetical protein